MLTSLYLYYLMIWLISSYILYLKIELPDYYVESLIRTLQGYCISKYGASALINRKHVIV